MEGDGDTESADSDSGSDSDNGDNYARGRGSRRRRRRAPSWHQQRRKAFVDRIQNEKFWDIQDEVERLTSLSFYFIRQCSRTSNIFDDLETFILPAEVEAGTTNIPTERAIDKQRRLLVRLRDKKFLQALQELQEHLRSDFKIEWLTLPFSPTDLEANKLANKKADWASDTHKEAVRLFAKTVNKIHEVKSLVVYTSDSLADY